ncbi:LPXTG cell wall anchor domain-containing protein [Secundilactobacillus hailunensis]|uniref:LPXTG cell wall anchor domain-containing protein n=1 Tax=Secundilactobacillus hailunensis TaxID=2559923 RepID=A0ABW1T9B2_9LACO|nr:LPXTG cell wall anchor domain-containing protein [Secundilactobacillus hailunensis]
MNCLSYITKLALRVNINNKQTVIAETKSDSTTQATQAVRHETTHSIFGVANKKAVVNQQTVIDNKNSQHLNKNQMMGASNKLPQTDESQSNSIFAKIGLKLMGILALVGLAKKKQKHDQNN